MRYGPVALNSPIDFAFSLNSSLMIFTSSVAITGGPILNFFANGKSGTPISPIDGSGGVSVKISFSWTFSTSRFFSSINLFNASLTNSRHWDFTSDIKISPKLIYTIIFISYYRKDFQVRVESYIEIDAAITWNSPFSKTFCLLNEPYLNWFESELFSSFNFVQQVHSE